MVRIFCSCLAFFVRVLHICLAGSLAPTLLRVVEISKNMNINIMAKLRQVPTLLLIFFAIQVI